MNDKVNIIIDGNNIQVPKDFTILEATKMVNIKIPTLCYLKDINEIGACRMCVVEVKGAKALQAACIYPVSEGLEIKTNTETTRRARRNTLELILSNHDKSCLSCIRNRNCELQTLAEELSVKSEKYEGEMTNDDMPPDDFSPSLVRNPAKCILCRRCVSACKNQTVNVIDVMGRGFTSRVGCAFEASIADVPCVYCGQCIVSCPTGALREKDGIAAAWRAINNPDKYVVVQTAPAVRAALGEEFGYPIGTPVTGKMVAAIKKLGVDKVFDTDTGADLTIMEEGTELIDRLQNNGKLPLITSCSPGWVKFCEHYYPELLDNLSSCKSPHEMFGATIKSYYAEKEGIDPESIVTISIMPCTSKKYEAQRPEHTYNGLRDVDISLTTRELAAMIKECYIDFDSLDDEMFDDPMGEATGAGVIFGATGGVMEAALRTVADVLTGEDLQNIDYTEVRGTEGIKEADVEIAGKTLSVAVVSGLKNARKVLDAIVAGEKSYDFIEIMACPGGCVCGGGQPIQPSSVASWVDLKAERAKALYTEDKSLTFRKSHQNPVIIQLYDEFYGVPGSHLAHELLHTTYTPREYYPEEIISSSDITKSSVHAADKV